MRTLLIVVVAIFSYFCFALPFAVIVGRMIAGPRQAEPSRTEHGGAAVGSNDGNGATIVVTCRVCATLVRIEDIDGRHLVERAGFLAAHGACLSQIAGSSLRRRSA